MNPIPPSSTAAPARSVELAVEGVWKAFDDNAVLVGVDLAVAQGEVVAIVGDSGCGKSVLLEIMTGRLEPDRGRVLTVHRDERGAPLVDLALSADDVRDDIREQWAIVFQSNALFSGTVYENIALLLDEVHGLTEPEIGRRVREAVRSVGLDPDRILDEQREELSGGMAKRVAIARALAMDPTLVFYDEPTTGLDPGHGSKIVELISATHDTPTSGGESRTSIIVTHDRELLRRLEPRVVMLDEGRVFFDGDYDSFVRSDSEEIRPYFELMPVLHRSKGR